MNIHPLLDFALANPWLAFGLAWPLALFLASFSWVVASQIETAMRIAHAIVVQYGNLLVILIKGYPPAATPALPAVPVDGGDVQ